MQASKFISQYLRHPAVTGAILPSTSYLSERMVERVDFKNAEIIVELGAGTGAITSVLNSRKRKETSLLVFEPNETFFKSLEERFSGEHTFIFKDFAEELPQRLKERGLKRADAVVSSLPLANWGEERRGALFSMLTNSIWRGGVYTQYQYVLPTYTSELGKYFGKVNRGFTLLNVPPAWVYTCRR